MKIYPCFKIEMLLGLIVFLAPCVFTFCFPASLTVTWPVLLIFGIALIDLGRFSLPLYSRNRSESNVNLSIPSECHHEITLERASRAIKLFVYFDGSPGRFAGEISVAESSSVPLGLPFFHGWRRTSAPAHGKFVFEQDAKTVRINFKIAWRDPAQNTNCSVEKVLIVILPT